MINIFDIKKFVHTHLKKGVKMLYCLCKNKEDKTYHLFECEKKSDDSCSLKNKTSFCNKKTLSKYSSEYECKFACKNIKDTRIKIAELANKGEQICGLCVSHLYKNN